MKPISTSKTQQAKVEMWTKTIMRQTSTKQAAMWHRPNGRMPPCLMLVSQVQIRKSNRSVKLLNGSTSVPLAAARNVVELQLKWSYTGRMLPKLS